MWISYIRHAGGDAVTSEGRSGLNLPEIIESLEWLNDLNVLHGVTAHPGPGGPSVWGRVQGSSAANRGRRQSAAALGMFSGAGVSAMTLHEGSDETDEV
jgi:hypothetical protein